MFQDNLKALRKRKGITQEELATRLNIVRQTVSKWEKGLSVPDSELLIKLAEILEVPVSQLLGSKILRKGEGTYQKIDIAFLPKRIFLPRTATRP